MASRLRRRAPGAEKAGDEGPFVSFTDLFIGILFLFLILVAALMLIHQEAMARAREEMQRMAEEIRILQAQLDAIAKLDADHTPFRLAIVYNSYQKPAGSPADWRYSRTVQVFRSPDGLCLENVILRNNLNLTWKSGVGAPEIPTAADQEAVRRGTPCALLPAGESWDTTSETGGVVRTSMNEYNGSTVLHTNEGDKVVELQYRVLGIYDDYYRGFTPRRPPPLPEASAGTPAGRVSLQ